MVDQASIENLQVVQETNVIMERIEAAAYQNGTTLLVF